MLAKDPEGMDMYWRSDFTNFSSFYEAFNKDHELALKFHQYMGQFPSLIIETFPETQTKLSDFTMRYIYIVAYGIEAKERETKD